MKGQKIRLIGSIASLFVTVLILVFTLYGWYVSNEQASVTGATGVTANDDSVRFMDDVLAVRHNLNGDIITNTYERDTDGKLVLKRSEIYTASTNTTEVITTFAEKTYFVVTEMLPGEYVDVTIGYSIDESKNGHNYKIYMKEIYGDDFVIDGKTHYVTGVFKYMSTGLKNASDTSISDFTPDTEYTWFNSYNIAQNDSPTLDKVIMNSIFEFFLF